VSSYNYKRFTRTKRKYKSDEEASPSNSYINLLS